VKNFNQVSIDKFIQFYLSVLKRYLIFKVPLKFNLLFAPPKIYHFPYLIIPISTEIEIAFVRVQLYTMN
jgi:hypothetical protein